MDFPLSTAYERSFVMLGDTIAAVSTPRGKGGVALLRVSGPDAVRIAARVFRPKNGRTLAEVSPRTAVYGEILSPETNGEWLPVDDGIATVFYAPASFTGEDTVELCCHGGMLLTETVLTALLTAGARPAEAGEFTRRAFLNGKLGLSSAEALGNVLEAGTHEQLKLAHAGLGGKVEARCQEIYARLRSVLASIYVKIDYPDEDLADMSREEIAEAFLHCEA
ncbi:MAG: tRNA uridine-5-carboxymethylaminomethyl(34) synthesis GTPase MnmE, partial [Clostridia bacterium]|nr:tRNA uridine-5-carboxymethylaminomethyl(34) synthesis GTPase MnmE [Clostridia bacterium]